MPDFSALRKSMVSEQISARGINDQAVIDAFLKVPRHIFVDDKSEPSAYGDFPLPIGEGQTISQPYIVALMLERLGLKKDMKVLEIGTGSGYQTALLAEMCAEVFSVERVSSLAQKSQQILDELDYVNIKIKCGDGTLGWEENAPFDRIIVSAASAKIPEELVNQLKVDGRLIIPLGGSFSQSLTLLAKTLHGVLEENICGCVFVPLIDDKK